MQSIVKKHSIRLVSSIVLLLCCVLAIFFFTNRIVTKAATVGEIKERIASYQKNKKAFSDEVIQIQSLEKRVSVLESSVITNESIPELLSTLEDLAKTAGVTFEITSVQTPIENEIPKLVVECSIVGSHTKVLAFLSHIQQQSFVVAVSKLFLFSEEGQSSLSASTGVLSAGKQKNAPSVVKEKQWHAVATLYIQSF